MSKKQKPLFPWYTFTGKKGSLLVANHTNTVFNIEKSERLTALSDEIFYNGEYHIRTSKGELPSVFFYNIAL